MLSDHENYRSSYLEGNDRSLDDAPDFIKPPVDISSSLKQAKKSSSDEEFNSDDRIKIREALASVKQKEEGVIELQEANKLRKIFAYGAGIYVGIFTVLVMLTVWFSTKLSDNVLIALLTSFTANIIGVVGFVMAYLFKNNGQQDYRYRRSNYYNSQYPE